MHRANANCCWMSRNTTRLETQELVSERGAVHVAQEATQVTRCATRHDVMSPSVLCRWPLYYTQTNNNLLTHTNFLNISQYIVMFTLICKVCLRIYRPSVQRCCCGKQFLLLQLFARDISRETSHVYQGQMRCYHNALSQSGHYMSLSAFWVWADRNGKHCRECWRGLISKEHRWCSTAGLNEPFGLWGRQQGDKEEQLQTWQRLVHPLHHKPVLGCHRSNIFLVVRRIILPPL